MIGIYIVYTVYFIVIDWCPSIVTNKNIHTDVVIEALHSAHLYIDM